MKAQQCTYRVEWSEADKQWAGLCLEFPDLRCLHASQAEARVLIEQLVAELLEDTAPRRLPRPDKK